MSSQRSVKLPCRYTWLLAHWIYLSPVTLGGWRTPRGSNPVLEGSAGAEGAAGPWMPLVPPCPALRNPGSGTAPGLGQGSWKENVPCSQRSRESLEYCTARVCRGNTMGLGETPQKAIVPQPPMPRPRAGELLQRNLPSAETYCHSISETAKSHQII